MFFCMFRGLQNLVFPDTELILRPLFVHLVELTGCQISAAWAFFPHRMTSDTTSGSPSPIRNLARGRILTPNPSVWWVQSGFGGLEVACWPLVPKFAGSNPAEAVGFLRANKNPQHVGGHGCLSVVIVVLLSSGLCEEFITRSEESYRLWCVIECDLETS